MTNTRRNTIVLSALFVVLAIGVFSIYRNLVKKDNELKSENKKTSQKIAVLEAQISNIDSLMYEYELRKAMVAEQSKVVLSADSPTITYQYLLKLLSWMGRSMIYDFAASDKGKKETSYNEYVISGRCKYRDVYLFTKNIEHQRAVITLEDLAIGTDGVANSDSVSFSMVIRTHFQDGGLELAQLKPKTLPDKHTFYQLFKSRVYEKLPDYIEPDPSLISIDQCQLIGIADNRVFLKDTQGVIRILAPRDKVAWGYLYSIDANKGKATFIIDKYGTPEEQTLYITATK